MAKYLFDSARWTAAESWRTIRTVRADLPEGMRETLRGERKVVFHAALEQAQQQFLAAGSVGYESRPLNLFYGLAQAGRALAAASPNLSTRNPDDESRRWKSMSHGLGFAPTGQVGDFWRQTVVVTPSVQDTFSRVSIAIGSPYMQIQRVELGALAGQLPEFTTHWRSFTSWPQSLDATIEARIPGPTSVFPLRSYGGDPTVDAAGSYTADYPTLRDLAVRVDGDGVPLRDFNGSTLMLEVPEHLVEVQASRRVLAGSVPHLGSRYVFPEAGESTRALHPLMSWWMVLYAFSILARYHPKEWTETLQLTTSKVASQVEFLLDGAVSLIPEMIARQLSAADA